MLSGLRNEALSYTVTADPFHHSECSESQCKTQNLGFQKDTKHVCPVGEAEFPEFLCPDKIVQSEE